MHAFVTADFNISVILKADGTLDKITPEGFRAALQAIPELSGADVGVKVSDREHVLVHRGKEKQSADKIDVHVSVDGDVEGRIDSYSLRRRLTKVFVSTVEELKERKDVEDAYQSFPTVRITEIVKDRPDYNLQFRASEKTVQSVPQKTDEEKKLGYGKRTQRNGLMRLFGRR